MGKSTINGYVKLPEGILVGEMMLVSPLAWSHAGHWIFPLATSQKKRCVAVSMRGFNSQGWGNHGEPFSWTKLKTKVIFLLDNWWKLSFVGVLGFLLPLGWWNDPILSWKYGYFRQADSEHKEGFV